MVLVICLMVNRDIGSYRQVIKVLKNKILEVTNRRWRATTVISDFEQASMTAFETEFPWITATFILTKPLESNPEIKFSESVQKF